MLLPGSVNSIDPLTLAVSLYRSIYVAIIVLNRKLTDSADGTISVCKHAENTCFQS